MVGAFVSWALLLAFIPRLRSRLMDQPNKRSSHLVPTPRGGGVAFVLVATAASVILLVGVTTTFKPLSVSALPLVAFPLAVVGFLDDRLNLPASWRYGAQLLTAFLMLSLSPTQLPLHGRGL